MLEIFLKHFLLQLALKRIIQIQVKLFEQVGGRHLEILQSKTKEMSIVHLNTQSMISSIDEFRLLLETYQFDIAVLSETWLKNKPLLLKHVAISGYTFEYHNRVKIKVGGVGFYVKESISYKRRHGLEKKSPDLEHLWLELPANVTVF